jgi:hypothetical protein
MKTTDRREFLTLAAASSVILVIPALGQTTAAPNQPATSASPAPQADKPKRPDPLAAELVKAFVVAGHSDLPKTQQLLAETPGLLNATWDWGGGDFETALGGAGHMGRKDIAEFLIGQGCRMDIFHAAMLGNIDYVKAALTAFPNLINSKGPHGIPLMAHAKKRGEENTAMVTFLESWKA